MKNNGVRLMPNYFKAMFGRRKMSHILHRVFKRYCIPSILQNREVRANISSVIIRIINIEGHSSTSHVLGCASRGLPVQVSQTLRPLETYIVVNF
jgi:hypothetical protein